MAKPKEKEPVDIVHQNAIHVETIMKELRTQKLYTEFNINPSKKLHVLTDKPMSNITYRREEEDPAFLQAVHGARLEPAKKYSHPQTEAQEIGWISTPLEDHVSRFELLKRQMEEKEERQIQDIHIS
ncbi:cilia- and flagella-associated protein 144 isoform X2 [Siphateles boraxobius]|uniref:cilia- and flagella-associated protein 144 isoform X2 n=1 Tax=Siphateles boraxobius TaxID=180520 RepID=UPI004062A1F5